MSFQDKIIEAAMSLNKEGDSVDVAPDVMESKLYKHCQRANVTLKEDGISVAWDDGKQCAVVCKGKPAPAPVKTLPKQPFTSFDSGWGRDAKKED